MIARVPGGTDMSRILIVYGTAYGQTARVAQRIAGVLTAAGHAVDLYQGDRLPRDLALAQYDGVLLAASVIMGHHQAYIRHFARRHAGELNRGRSAFVSVCGAASGNPAEAQGYIDALLRQTGWQPKVTRSFTGAVAYTKYGWVTRLVLKAISKRKGLATDTSRDWDFTEWDEVERFGRTLAVTLTPTPAPPPVPAA
jgi:menaquinone-dependent protoporphyrinogen oxidase